MPLVRPSGTPNVEDELDDLPPIDGDEVEEEGLEAEDLDEAPADGGDPMDDSTGEEDPLEEIEVPGSESGWLDDAGDSETLDVGTPEAFGAEEESSTLLEGAEEPDDDDEISFDGGAGGEADSLVGDAGEEGFADEEEDLREEDLPRLDSGSDDTDADETDVLAALPEDEFSEEPRPAWDDRGWERVEDGPELAAAVDLMACGAAGGERLVVGGQGLWRLGAATDDGDRAQRFVPLEAAGLRAAPRGLVLAAGALVVSTARLGVLLSTDGGQTFRDVNGWRPLVAPAEADGLLEIVATGEELWGRTTGGALVWSGDRGASWSRVLPDYRFEAIASDAVRGEVVALAREVAGATIARGSGGKLVVGSSGVLPAGRIVAFAAEDGRLAVALGRGVFREEGPEWARLDGTAGLTAMTFARGDGTLIIALHSEGEGRTWILEARAGAPALTVAEMGDASANGPSDEEDEARVRALSWDPAAGVVWAGGAFGLVAWRPARH